MRIFITSLFLLIQFCQVSGQPVEVQYDYDAIGDCIFSATNNSKAPLYLNINFADLQNTAFTENLPYVKRLTPGFNALFTLQRDIDAGVPSFHYEVKWFRSDPMPNVELDFPYLIPFAPGKKVKVFNVQNIDGFWGSKGLDEWSATGFYAKPGDKVYASRTGIVVEMVGADRKGDPQNWYNTWNNAITLLQADGTLICYKNVVDNTKKFKVGDTVYAGQILGQLVKGSNQLKVLIYHDSLNTKGMIFIIPQFQTAGKKGEILNSANDYVASHPKEIRGLEMSKREKKKVLGKK